MKTQLALLLAVSSVAAFTPTSRQQMSNVALPMAASDEQAPKQSKRKMVAKVNTCS